MAQSRKTFAYTGDDGDDYLPETGGIDSEEQEAIVAQLHARLGESNILFKYAIMGLCSISLVWTLLSTYLIPLSANGGGGALTALLRVFPVVISLLIATSIRVRHVPPRLNFFKIPSVLKSETVRAWSVPFNAVLILAVVANMVWGHELIWLAFPTLVSFGTAVYAKYELSKLDKEMDQLEKSKYQYRGA